MRRLLALFTLLCLTSLARADDLPLFGVGRGAGNTPFYTSNSCNTVNGSAGTTACTLGTGVSAGDTAVIFLDQSNSGFGITTLTDDKSDTCTAVDNVAWNSSGSHQGFSYYCANLTAGATTFTVTWHTAEANELIAVDIYRNIKTSALLDNHHAAAQTSPGNGANAVSSGSATTTVNGDLIAAAMFSDNANLGTGFSQPQAQVSGWFNVEYLIQSTAASIAGTFTATNTPGFTVAFMMALEHK